MELLLLIIIIILLFVFWKLVVWILLLVILLWLMSVICKKSFIFKPLVFSIILVLSTLLLTFVADLMLNDGRNSLFAKYIVPFEIVNSYEYKSHSMIDEIVDSIHSDTIHKNKNYELYNRIVGADSTHLYGEFYIGMPMYEYLNISDDNELYYYYWNNPSKYELVDSLNFSLDGIFLKRKLIGVKFLSDEIDNYDNNINSYIEKLKKTLSKKYGLIHYEKKGNNFYRGSWRFDKKHIVISSQCLKSFYKQSQIELYIYNPMVIREECIRRQTILKQKEIQLEEEVRQLELELKEQFEIKKNDSINEVKRRKRQQEGF